MKKLSVTKGTKFNRLTYIVDVGSSAKGYSLGLYKCDCGNETILSNSRVKLGNNKSCGCAIFDHGLHSHRLYNTRLGMMHRCYNKNTPSYKYYGEKGIIVCDRRKDIDLFIQDMYPSYIEGLTLDRIDSTKGYFKFNCKRSTDKEQSINRSATTIIKYKSFEGTLPDLCREMGLNYKTIYSRTTKCNMSLEDAINYVR